MPRSTPTSSHDSHAGRAWGWVGPDRWDTTEVAVLNALWHAESTEGRDGRVIEALPQDEVLELLAAHRRLEG
jgi:hypothetical protein